jgi:hypothetical protein
MNYCEHCGKPATHASDLGSDFDWLCDNCKSCPECSRLTCDDCKDDENDQYCSKCNPEKVCEGCHEGECLCEQEGWDYKRYEQLRSQYHNNKCTPEDVEGEFKDCYGARAGGLLTRLLFGDTRDI